MEFCFKQKCEESSLTTEKILFSTDMKYHNILLGFVKLCNENSEQRFLMI